MAITDPNATQFVTRTVRPRCETMRQLKHQIDDALVEWFAHQSALIPNDASETIPNETVLTTDAARELNGANVNNVMNQLLAFQTAMNLPGVMDVITKPCVNALDVR